MQILSIGRDATNQIVINDTMVSRQHAQLTILDNGQVLLKDLGSSNGTFINGNRITESFLQKGDIVKCGSSFLDWTNYLSNGQTNISNNESKKFNFEIEKNSFSNFSGSIDVSSLKHEKESIYYIVKLIFSSLIWLIIASFLIVPFFLSSFIGFRYFLATGISSLMVLAFIIGLVALFIWLTSLYFKAIIYGNSVKVNVNQYPQLYKILVEQCQRLGLSKIPDLFIFNSNGMVNAVAISFYSKKYVLLMSSLVDLMLSNDRNDEIAMIIGHELGHHAAGHNSFWKNFFLKPASVIPFLSKAYSRACELTADRIGLVLTNNVNASQRALVALALGSERLSKSSNISEFIQQETEISDLMGFINKLFSSHPRTTKRVVEITSYANKIKIS